MLTIGVVLRSAELARLEQSLLDAERIVSVVHLPTEDMKGRVIVCEIRNIWAIEAATGVDLIIGGTPQAAIVVSQSESAGVRTSPIRSRRWRSRLQCARAEGVVCSSLAGDKACRIESEVACPEQIEVAVIRELRVSD